jgi:hypothetical protein
MVISAKEHVNQPSSPPQTTFASESKYTSKDALYLRVLLGASLSFQKQVLGWTYMFTHGEASGFFVFRRHLVRRIAHPLRPPMLAFDCPDSHLHSIAGSPFIRLVRSIPNRASQ